MQRAGVSNLYPIIYSGLFNTNQPTEGINWMFNIGTIKVGGIRFIKVGKLCFSFCVTQKYKALKG